MNHEILFEISRLQKIIKNLEKIKSGASDENQKNRVIMDLDKYRRMLGDLGPSGMIDNAEKAAATSKALADGDPDLKYKIISKFPVLKICPNSNDPEVNQVGTLIMALDHEYVPSLGDGQVKLAFSHANERDGLMKKMEGVKRTLKVLTETIEEFVVTDKQEFREQLGRMKNKQSRAFIAEAYETFKGFRDFLEKINREINEGQNVILNLDEYIRFNNRFDKATVLNNRPIPEAIREFHGFCREAVDLIKLPDIR
jgi:hypothetical protein